jgi:hypothetical protein
MADVAKRWRKFLKCSNRSKRACVFIGMTVSCFSCSDNQLVLGEAIPGQRFTQRAASAQWYIHNGLFWVVWMIQLEIADCYKVIRCN